MLRLLLFNVFIQHTSNYEMNKFSVMKFHTFSNKTNKKKIIK